MQPATHLASEPVPGRLPAAPRSRHWLAILDSRGVIQQLGHPEAVGSNSLLSLEKGTLLWEHLDANDGERLRYQIGRCLESRVPHRGRYTIRGRTVESAIACTTRDTGILPHVLFLAWDADHPTPVQIGDSLDEAEAVSRQLPVASQTRICQGLARLAASPDLPSALHTLLRIALEVSGFEAGVAYVFEGDHAVVSDQIGIDPEFLEPVSRRHLTLPHIRWALENPNTLLDAAATFPDLQRRGEPFGIRHVHFAALASKAEVLGLLFLVSHRHEPPSNVGLLAGQWTITLSSPVLAGIAATDHLTSLNRHLAGVLATSPLGIAHVRERRIVWDNAAHAALFGYRPGETRGLATAVLHAAERAYQHLGEECSTRFARGETFETEAQLRRKDGSTLWCTLTGRAIDPRDPALGAIWVVQDSSQRRELVESLRHGEARSRSTLAAMAEGLILYDRDLRILDCNQSAESILGLSRNRLLDRTVHDAAWQAFHEDGRPYAPEEFPAVVTARTGKPCRGILMGVDRPEGDRRWILINAEPLRAESDPADADPTGFVVSFADVTRLRAMEAEVRSAQERLHKAQRLESLAQLAGGVAHEFNNILAALMLDLSELAGASTGQETLVNEMERLCRRGAEVVRRILAFGRRSIMEATRMDLAPTLRDEAARLHDSSIPGLEVVSRFPPSLPAVHADADLIRQVIGLLCDNALDAMPRGGRLTLEASTHHGPSEMEGDDAGQGPRTLVVFSVTDTGCGMTDAVLQRLFEPFFTTKPVGTATGLGLATVRGIVQQHRGWIRVRSSPGQGSTFVVYLPVAEDVDGPDSLRTDSRRPTEGSPTILLVEDEPGLRQATRRVLARSGFRIVEASNATEALLRWETHPDPIHLLFTDMIMPGGVSGLELARQLRRRSPELAVVITSGYSEPVVHPEEFGRQRMEYLPKPTTAAVILETVRRCLRRGFAVRDGSTPPPPEPGHPIP